MSRGNRRLALFKDEADYLLFLESIMRVKILQIITKQRMMILRNSRKLVLRKQSQNW
jgi:hypothetical protein